MEKEFTIRVQHPLTIHFYTCIQKRKGRLFLAHGNKRRQLLAANETTKMEQASLPKYPDFTLRNILGVQQRLKTQRETVQSLNDESRKEI
ncbi:hypothetical protein GUITHDRAFT_155500 [Guillardia theta CCMP2712]|uniref:Uncharacterized protein n=1 Tax=Guillardia theta (strain CCMP2712) TaxID=905079 RepID=L1IGN5_GUITC|nr:hypothetical protein GUITHDRAFT_155500 [Guillardia theta CCMP2712]EKX35383.1 hypothetical protein GUITHDRAFT_155500 [Guillardia theta CCMP2712]|eukprot:XP_005822363.1 hypothetical protein GUITHDRAFT_155500 [Guillardia theta CCMP2712]